MTTRHDLDRLDEVACLPLEARLAALVENELTGDQYSERLAGLASALGFPRPEGLKVWFKQHRIPLQHLPGIADELGIGLSVLVALYFAQEAPAGLSKRLYEAARPRVTDREFDLIQQARSVFLDDIEDASESRLIAERQ